MVGLEDSGDAGDAQRAKTNTARVAEVVDAGSHEASVVQRLQHVRRLVISPDEDSQDGRHLAAAGIIMERVHVPVFGWYCHGLQIGGRTHRLEVPTNHEEVNGAAHAALLLQNRGVDSV